MCEFECFLPTLVLPCFAKRNPKTTVIIITRLLGLGGEDRRLSLKIIHNIFFVLMTYVSPFHMLRVKFYSGLDLDSLKKMFEIVSLDHISHL